MKTFTFDVEKHISLFVALLKEIESYDSLSNEKLAKIVKKYAKENGDVFSKDHIINAYKRLAGTHGLKPFNQNIIQQIKMKPVRTVSGVAPITVLTKPFPCPGKCIFCPNDIRMPKSYLSDEPGAQRAERNYFDPYLQTYNRLLALQTIGHTITKAEIIVLGGTWSYYPENYQIWFIKECFRALNDFNTHDDRNRIIKIYEEMEKKYHILKKHGSSNNPHVNKKRLQDKQIDGRHLEKSYNRVISETYVAPERIAGFDMYQSATWEELYVEHKKNEIAHIRSVGLVIETRPDNISEQEVIRIRRLGCTKTQIGFQSLQDSVLSKNKRGHDVAATRNAISLLRQAGFKIHAHWMPNLYGSSVQKDMEDYEKLFSDVDFKPDELKIYPCSLIESAELMQYYEKELWKPYSYEDLLQVLTYCLQNTPAYCRLTRVIRDIPSTDIVEGNKLTNFREIAENNLKKLHMQSKDIRAREIRGNLFDENTIQCNDIVYETSVSTEHFLEYTAEEKINKERKILGFLRLSLPKKQTYIKEIQDSAVIREIHVYGQVVSIGDQDAKKAQHLGLGTKLIEKAKQISKEHEFKSISVISAIGTREYYRKKGFTDGELYQHCEI